MDTIQIPDGIQKVSWKYAKSIWILSGYFNQMDRTNNTVHWTIVLTNVGNSKKFLSFFQFPIFGFMKGAKNLRVLAQSTHQFEALKKLHQAQLPINQGKQEISFISNSFSTTIYILSNKIRSAKSNFIVFIHNFHKLHGSSAQICPIKQSFKS